MIWTSLIAQGKRRLWMSLFVAALIALVFLHFARFYQGRVSGYILVGLAIPVLANVLRAGLGLVYRLERHPFRVLDLGMASDHAAPGGSLPLELVLEARRVATLTRVAVELRASRTQSVSAGKKISDLHRETRVLEENLELEPGFRKSYRFAVDVPEGAPFSFRSMEGKIVWSIGIEAEVAGWGVLRDELDFTVAPA